MEIVQPLAAIVLVMALLGGALVLLKKRGAAFRMPGLASPAARRLQVMERVSLGPQHALHLVRVDGRTMVVTTAPGGCQIVEHALTGEERF